MQATTMQISTDHGVSLMWICGRLNARTLSKWHCALAESWNAALKVERVHRTVYPTREKAMQDIARYIELRYNRTRLHSALGYRTPQEVHNEFLNRKLAA